MATATGKTIRLHRIFNPAGRAVAFAPVHNMTSVEPFAGQADVPGAVQQAVSGGATAIVLSKGSLRQCAPEWAGGVGVFHYLFSYTPLGPDPIRQVPVGTVEESMRLGADGVCVFVGLATENDESVIRHLGSIGEECDRLGMVFVCEAEFPGFYESMADNLNSHGLRYLKYVARLCAELGADVVSTNWPGREEEFAEIVDYVKIPVLLNGGPEMPEAEFLAMLDSGLRVGARGCLVGRNFSERSSIERTVRAAADIILGSRPATPAVGSSDPHRTSNNGRPEAPVRAR